MLSKHLYRSLLRQSIKIDRNPRMKAFIFTTEATFPRDGYEDVKIERVFNEGTADRAMNDLVRGFCSPGVFYKPNKSLTKLVRETFRKPPADLNETQLHQLGFMAVRQLFNCEAIATSLTIRKELPYESLDNIVMAIEPATPPTEVPVPVAQIPAVPTEPVSLTHTDTAEIGSLLVAHPLRTDDLFSSSILLVTQVGENHSTGLILNRDYRENFKSRLTKGERVRYGAFLKYFYDMPCFYGGYERVDRHIDFSILHQQDSLADVSTRIDLFSPEQASAVLEQLEPATENTESAENTSAEAVSASPQKNYVYLSYDFRAIGEQLALGTVLPSDLKVVQGESIWLEQELQDSLRANKFFALRTNAAASIALLPPAPESYEDPQYAATLSDPRVWYSGQYSWSKLLILMGGEYRDFARLQRITHAKHANLYMDILPTLPGFDMKEPEISDSDFEDYDSEEEMDPLARALQVVTDLSDKGFDLDGLTIDIGELLDDQDEDSDDDDGDDL